MFMKPIRAVVENDSLVECFITHVINSVYSLKIRSGMVIHVVIW